MRFIDSSGYRNGRVLRSSCLTARPCLQECPFRLHPGADASAFVNTAISRKAVEVARSKQTEQEAIGMDEAKSRELTELIQEEAIRKVGEDQEIPESRLMSM